MCTESRVGAEILDVDTPQWEAGMEIFRWRVWAEEMEWSLDKPPPLQLVRIRPERILYTMTQGTVLSAAGMLLSILGFLAAGRYGWWDARRPVELFGTEIDLLGL